MSTRETDFLEYVQAGGQVETRDWMPDDYRGKLVKFIEMHGNSELMGVLPEREWILRAPTLQRKRALNASPTSCRARRSSTTCSTTPRTRGGTSGSSPGSSTRRRSSPRRRCSS